MIITVYGRNIRHVGIIEYLDVEINEVCAGEVLFILFTEWDAGPPLTHASKHFGPIPEHLSRGYATQLIDALEHIKA